MAEEAPVAAAALHGILHQPGEPAAHADRRVSIAVREPGSELHHEEEGQTNMAFEPEQPASQETNGVHPPISAVDSVHAALSGMHHRTAVTGREQQGPGDSPTESMRSGGAGVAGAQQNSGQLSSDSYIYAAQPPKDSRWWVRLRLWPPSVAQVARFVALVFLGLLVWGVIYVLLGEDASPLGGQLFSLAALCIVAKLGGWLATRARLPALLGMLIIGILAKNLGLVSISGKYLLVVANVRRVALVIILIRAGLDLDPNATKKLFGTIMKLALGPWLIECLMIALTTNLLLGLPWGWALMLGSIEAAVSPAVVVPGLLRLRVKGFGVAKGIPTLILAVTGIDDAFSVAAFGVISSMMFTAGKLWYTISLGPASILMGIAFGVVWGNLTRFVPNRDDPYAAHLRVLLLFMGGLLAVLGSDEIGFGGAGPLGVIIAAYVSSCIWTAEGWEVEENPVAIAFEVFWLIFEPILFGITGTQIDFTILDASAMWLAVLCIVIAAAVRVVSTILLGIGSKLNLKEKIFCSFSWMAKATVQAALGPVALDLVGEEHPNKDYAGIVLMVCVLSILLTAPIGAVTIALSGPRLLKRTSPPLTDGWRRHARPSLRDISIYDEEEVREEAEDRPATQADIEADSKSENTHI